MKYVKKIALLILLFNLTLSLFAEKKSVELILEKYDANQIGTTEAIEIMEALKIEGYKPGPELDKLIVDQGFDSLKLRGLAPPPGKMKNGGKDDIKRRDKRQNSGKIYSSLEIEFKNSNFVLKSSAVTNGELLDDFKGEEKIDGIEKSIPLNWENVPSGTTSLAIVMYHYPKTDDKTSVNSYLLLWNIDPTITDIGHGEADDGDWQMGSNKDGNKISYTSPNSPSAGQHTYIISIFALKNALDTLPVESSLEVDFDTFMTAIENNEIIGKADLIFKDVTL